MQANLTGLVATRTPRAAHGAAAETSQAQRGFGGSGQNKARRKGGKKRSPALSKADWGPLGKHPDLDAIVARQRLQLPLAGRIGADDVNRAWKSAAAEHHPGKWGAGSAARPQHRGGKVRLNKYRMAVPSPMHPP
jgi:hypothetical protein